MSYGVIHMNTTDFDKQRLDLAVRSAVRGHGQVEPNPMVGCVISDSDGNVIAAAHHERFGGPHAEALALRKAGSAARGSTVHVTLEPCTHQGKTPACADALVKAEVSRVVIGSGDPNPLARGGAERLREAGIQVDFVDHLPSMNLIAPFHVNILHKRPWVMIKWAQTLDGRIATRTGDSKWISSETSRRLVHRERGRVDAILTGIGTVLQDDPQLTARNVRIRRTATRIVLDPSLKTPLESSLVSTIDVAPLLIVTDADLLGSPKAAALVAKGTQLIGFPIEDGHFDLKALMQHLYESHDMSTVMVEAGTGLMSSFVRSGCADELAIFVAPRLLGDDQGYPPLTGAAAESIRNADHVQVEQLHHRDADLLLRCRLNS